MRRPPVAGRCSPPHGAAAGCRSSGFDRRANLSNCILADLRSAGSHCENSGSSDGSGASARSDRVKSEVFRDRSASAGGDTRYFSRCLIFWCFWIKPKARKKESKRIFFSIDPSGNNPAPPIVRLLQGADLPPFVTKRWCQKCPPGEKLRETHSASLKRAPVAGLQANRPRFLTPVAARFFFRTFRNAETVVRSAQR